MIIAVQLPLSKNTMTMNACNAISGTIHWFTLVHKSIGFKKSHSKSLYNIIYDFISFRSAAACYSGGEERHGNKEEKKALKTYKPYCGK